MSSKFIRIVEEIPEWGISPTVSIAVPIVASGAQIRSTRPVSDAMNTVLRASIDKDLIERARKVVARAKQEKSKKTRTSENLYAAHFFSTSKSRRPSTGTSRKRRRK